jgi:hypothetical protein
MPLSERLATNPSEYVSKLVSDLSSGANFHQKHNLLKELKIVSRDRMNYFHFLNCMMSVFLSFVCLFFDDLAANQSI